MSTPSTNWSTTSTPVRANEATKVFSRVIASRIDANEIYQRGVVATDGPHSALLVPPGHVSIFAGATIPGGYLACNGQAVSRSLYAALFDAIGTAYGAGNGSTTFKVPRLADITTVSGIELGYLIDKDMTDGSAPSIPSEYAPNGVGYGGGDNAFYWDDWDNDIFDDWGYFYIFDPASSSYHFIQLSPNNQDDFSFTTQEVLAFERTFYVTHGYAARGIFRFEIRCTDDNPFIFGAYGDMGSDGNTINTNESDSFDFGTLFYNRNVEDGDEIERFFSYFIPFRPADNTTKTYTDGLTDSDVLYLHSKAITRGLTVYFSKKVDVKEFVKADLALDGADIRGGNLTFDEAGNPIATGSTQNLKYVIKY